MKTKFLLFLFLSTFIQTVVSGQYLLSYYQNAGVCFQNKENGQYISSSNNVNVFYEGSNVANQYFNQNYKIENGVTNNYYRIRHLATGKYLTVIVSPGYMELKTLGDCPNTDYQEFQFIQQTPNYYYKIHAHFSHNGLNEVFTIHAGNDHTIFLDPNQTTGNSNEQKWYLTNLNPPTSPSDAIPSLADQFENKTVGFTEQQYNNNVQGFPASNIIYAGGTYTGFEEQFKIEYTDEVGWYRIRHNASGKWVTINGAYPGNKIELQNYTSLTNQKFKFIYKSPDKYEIHSKYTQGPELDNNAALLLQMAPNDPNFHMTLGADNTIGAASSSWQLFKITKYVNPAQPAEFNSGAAVAGSGKVLGKQYYISSRETLALLEPYKVGNDTFVRTQQSPVYGEQSEWIFDAGETVNGAQTVRIRYAKTGQYLYLPVATQNTQPNPETRLKLTSQLPDDRDLRYEFYLTGDGNVDHRFSIASNVNNGSTNTYNRVLQISQTGYLETGNSNSLVIDPAESDFYINLSLPTNGNNTYAIVTKNSGHYMNDNGIKGTVPVIHSKYADYSSTWHLIPVSGGYLVQNQLTRQYLYSPSSSVATQVYTAPNLDGDKTKWKITRSGNFFDFENAGNGHHLNIAGHTDDGDGVYQDIPTTGSDWVVSRADYTYLADPVLRAVYSPGILEDYFVSATHALNNNTYLNNMLKNVGLPFEPSLQTTLFGTTQGNQNLIDEGFATTGTIPSFLPVVKSALISTFNYSSARADSAIRNYKIDTAGHRVDMAYALKKYMIENLSTRPNTTWTANETALVAWLERQVKAIRVNYANRLEASWEDYKADAHSDVLTFSNVLLDGDVINTSLFSDVDYYPVGINTQVSLKEYAFINKGRNYKNPGIIATLTIPALGGSAGITALTVGIARTVATAVTPLIAEAQIEVNSALQLGERAAIHTARAALKAVQGTARLASRIASIGNASIVASVVTIAIEVLVTRALEVAEYVNFENDLYDKIDRSRNTPISIQSITQSPSLLDKIALNQDLDWIFATGERGIPIAGTYTFNGNGNWSNPANWVNGAMPPNPLSDPNQEIIINNSGGSCILDIPYRIPPNSFNSRILIKPGKVLQLQNTLTVPSAKIIKPQ